MRLFEVLDEKMSHSDTIQVDGAFAIAHVRNDVTSELHEANAGGICRYVLCLHWIVCWNEIRAVNGGKARFVETILVRVYKCF